MSTEPEGQFSARLFYLLLCIGIALNARGLFIPVLEPDSALYATIAKRIALSGDWLNLYADGGDWLDKPHFPFWIAAISFKIFGISAFSYKLASFFFWLISIAFTYLLTKLLYNVTVARYAVIIYITALHAVIANFDVRAEPYLTGCVMGAIYFIYLLQQHNKIYYLFAAAFFTACAVMTKGIFILSDIGGGFIVYWIIKKDWKQFINYKWWLLVACSFIFILPELYALYRQFDMHPEKIVFGHTNVSGIRFFFWDSQFGRFFNTGPIKGTGNPFFFLHTSLWAFLPWSILLIIAIVQLCRGKLTFKKEHSIIYGSALIIFLLFSFSGFQLPHYIIIIFPHFSILCALYLYHYAGNKKTVSAIIGLQNAMIAAVFCVAITVVVKFSFAMAVYAFILPATVAAIFFYRKPFVENIILKGMFFAVILHSFLNVYFYPNILQYQAGMRAALWMNKNKPGETIVEYKYSSYTLEFYSSAEYTPADEQVLQNKIIIKPVVIFTTRKESDSLIAHHFKVEQLQSFPHFKVSTLNAAFLYAKTRQAGLQPIVLAKVSKQG